MSKRVWQYPEVTSIAADDYLLLDNETDGSKSILASKVGAILINKVVTERKVYKASDETGVVNGYKEVSVEVPYTTITDLEGDIVTFDDGEDLPLASLKVGIEPIQDLHGYDHPWVGGSGKNKFDKSTVNVDKYIGADGQLATSQYNQDVTDFIPVTSGQSYIINSSISTDYYSCFYDENENVVGSIFANNQFPKVAPSDAKYIRVTFAKADINTFMVEQGTTASSTYYPYSNECPISGWDEANIVVSPTTDAEDGTTYTLDLDGTRYGGKVDLVSGVMTVDRVGVIYDGSSDENWAVQGNAGFYIDVSDKKAGMNNYIANNYMATDQSGWDVRTPINSFSGHPTLSRLYFRYPYEGFSADLTAWKTWLASNNVQVCYELATPLTYQLTPTQVKSLLGSNNVWGDCGKSLVSYQKTWVQPDFTPDNN